MQTPQNAVRLPIYLGEQALLLKAREVCLAGATVFRGQMGHGHSNVVHTNNLMEMATDLPVIVEIVDPSDKINAFLPVLETLLTDGFVTLQPVQRMEFRPAVETP